MPSEIVPTRFDTFIENLTQWCGEKIAKYFKLISCMLIVALVGKGIALASGHKYGDFQPLVNAVQRLAFGEPLYKIGVTDPEYVYSPLFALLISPFSYIPSEVFRFFWLFINAGSLVLAYKSASRISGVAALESLTQYKIVVITIFVAWYWIFYNLINGQVNPLLLCLTLLSLEAALRDRPILSGVLLALAVQSKPFPLIFIPILLLIGKRKAVVAAVCSLGACIAAPYLYFKDQYFLTLSGWLDANREQQTIYDVSDSGHQSISAFFFRSFGRINPEPFSLNFSDPVNVSIAVTLSVVFLTSFALIWKFRAHPRFALAMGFILWATTPPTSWKHYYLVLLLPLLVLAKDSFSKTPTSIYSKRFLIGCGVFMLLKYIPVFGNPHFFLQASLFLWIGVFTAVMLSKIVSKGGGLS